MKFSLGFVYMSWLGQTVPTVRSLLCIFAPLSRKGISNWDIFVFIFDFTLKSNWTIQIHILITRGLNIFCHTYAMRRYKISYCQCLKLDTCSFVGHGEAWKSRGIACFYCEKSARFSFQYNIYIYFFFAFFDAILFGKSWTKILQTNQKKCWTTTTTTHNFKIYPTQMHISEITHTHLHLHITPYTIHPYMQS